MTILTITIRRQEPEEAAALHEIYSQPKGGAAQ